MQGVFWAGGPWISWLQVPLQYLALKEIWSQFTWNLVLGRFGGAPVGGNHPVVIDRTCWTKNNTSG